MKKRVVITGIGLLSALGDNTDDIVWRMKTEAPAFIRASFDPTVGLRPVPDFDIRKYTGRNKNIRYLNRGSQLSAASAMLAFTRSGLSKSLAAEAGLFAGAGPNFDISTEIKHMGPEGIQERKLPALWMLRFLPNTAASFMARMLGVRGENLTICTACAASLQAIGEAFRRVRDGYLPLALAGGGDSRLNPGGILAYKKAGALRIFLDTQSKAVDYHIFDKRHCGFIPGEGAAFFVLEQLEHAKRRKAEIHAEICGYGASISGGNMTAPDPHGVCEEKALTRAISDAGLALRQIDLVSAHGTGTPLNDKMESDMILRLFEDTMPPVIAIKSRIGHLASACGAVELGICIGLIKAGWLPAIPNLVHCCRENIRFVREDMSYSAHTVLLENFGFGGQNAALVIKKWKD